MSREIGTANFNIDDGQPLVMPIDRPMPGAREHQASQMENLIVVPKTKRQHTDSWMIRRWLETGRWPQRFYYK